LDADNEANKPFWQGLTTSLPGGLIMLRQIGDHFPLAGEK
jgi:hypothetical protein